jgi:hypothetical protein
MKMDMDMSEGMDEKESDKEEYDEYEVKHAVECLIEAEMIKKNSALMAKVQPALDEKMSALQKISSIDDLRKVAKKKLAE